MASKFTIQPPDLNECKSYEAFKREIVAWADVTDLAKKKQGNFIALSLPNKSKFGDGDGSKGTFNHYANHTQTK